MTRGKPATALALAAGPALIAYGCWIAARTRPPGPWYAQARRLRLIAVAAVAPD
jgi:hypothetical protein